MRLISIYITCKDGQEAQTIAQALLEQRLVACANILAPHQSMYWWEGKVQNAQEVAVIFKTRSELFEKAESAIKALHSYECPCIVVWPIEKGHAPFLAWIEQETEE